MVVVAVGFHRHLCVWLFALYLKNTGAARLDIDMFHSVSWEPVYFSVRRSRSRVQEKHCRLGFLHPCECWLHLVQSILHVQQHGIQRSLKFLTTGVTTCGRYVMWMVLGMTTRSCCGRTSDGRTVSCLSAWRNRSCMRSISRIWQRKTVRCSIACWPRPQT